MSNNVCWIHQSLRVTPAMQAGVTDHVWNLEEMNILATVDFGKITIPQHWELRDGDPSPFLIVNKLEDGRQIAVQLNKNLIKETAGRKYYLGTVKLLDAVILPSN